ncbi:MAG: hypothetical protein D6722_27955 [Bacteroidetes bacterium]|nr:MAG: hypothetical protein D6722_27955 [Bacteroidota bacterium]
MNYLRYAVLLACWLVQAFLPLQGQRAEALAYFAQYYKDYGLAPRDLTGLEVQDLYTSSHNQVTHVYLRQTWLGLEVVGVQAAVHLDAERKVVKAHSSLVSDLADKASVVNPGLTAVAATNRAAAYLGIALPTPLRALTEASGPAQAQTFAGDSLLLEDISVRLVWHPHRSRLLLAWEVRLYPPDAQHWWTVRIDAQDGTWISQEDWVTHDHWPAPGLEQSPVSLSGPPALSRVGPSYRVFPLPLESPSHGSRSLLIDPSDATASPYGWHDVDGQAGAEYTSTQGNNVDAYADPQNNNYPTPGSRADGGASLSFDFPLDLTQAPAAYRDAALTQLFYATNVAHDILYRYGFTEAAGNFQQNNYGRGGSGADPIRAEAQDGGATNSAIFSTPPDGFKPRMQMYLWTLSNPHRDGDLDNGIILHEYAHGLSQRLTGGPSSVFCLGHAEHMGEGWSDWFALMLTMQTGDQGTDARGLGTYGLAQATDGPGIRPMPYSTDLSVNDFTYDDIQTLSHPYGTGFGWATVLWDLTWALIDEHGFDPDWYQGNGGNNIALQLVVDAMKLQPCQPGFVDARDALLLADQLTYAGAHSCLLWEVFARRGLGYSADQGSSLSRADGTEAFDLPPACRKELQLSLEVSPDSVVTAGQNLFFLARLRNTKDTPLNDVVLTCPLPPGGSYVPNSATHGGSLQNGRVVFPGVVMSSGSQVERSFQIMADLAQYTTTTFADDMEGGTTHWQVSHGAGTADWGQSSILPHQGSRSWFAADVATTSDQYLSLATPLLLGSRPWLRFWHAFNTEAGLSSAYDGGVVEISVDGGGSWTDLGPVLTGQTYTHTVAGGTGSPLAGRLVFAGNSNGYVRTEADLSAYAGQSVLIRFRLATDSSVGQVGWYVDDVTVFDLVNIQGEGWAVASEGDSVFATSPPPGVVVTPPVSLPVNWIDFQANPWGQGIRLTWTTAAEENNTGFEVQRSARSDMQLTMPLGWVPGQGATKQGHTYFFTDSLVKRGGTYHYRLRQVDLDGQENYSPVVTVDLPYAGRIDLSPFPILPKISYPLPWWGIVGSRFGTA